MQAIILAAGTGSRLGKYTKDCTKCMIEVNGVTLIERMINSLVEINVTNITLVVGYKRDSLEALINEKYSKLNITFVENRDYYKTNNIFSLYLAKDILMADDTILLESDLIFDKEILKDLLQSKLPSLAVVDKFEPWMDGTCLALDGDNITGFFDKNAFNFNDTSEYFKTVNIYKFSKEFSSKVYVPFLEAYIKVVGDNEYYESVLKILVTLKNTELKALKTNGAKWYEIDDIHDKINAELIFAQSNEKLTKLQTRYGGYWKFPTLKDFCYLVNPYFPTKKMHDDIKFSYQDLITQYPSGQSIQNVLGAKLFNIDSENIMVTNGAAEVIKHLGSVLDGTFSIFTPTFDEYINAIGKERVIEFVRSDFKNELKIESILAAIDIADNLILINPDNPSGGKLSASNLQWILKYAKSKNKNVIVDESFLDFAVNGFAESLIKQEIIDEFENLIIIKSISKSYGVPGIRLGVVIANKALIEKLGTYTSIWNINSFAEYFLQIIGKYKKDYILSCTSIIEERERFFKKLQVQSCITAYRSEANYFFCEVHGMTSKQLCEKLLEANIYVKDLTGKKGIIGECIRIAVRDTKDNNALISRLTYM